MSFAECSIRIEGEHNVGHDPVQLISSDPETLVFSCEDLALSHADLNVDVEVRDESGRWTATFFTLANLATLLERYASSGECADGTYLWALDMIVLAEISADTIRRTVEDLRQSDEFERAFGRVDGH